MLNLQKYLHLFKSTIIEIGKRPQTLDKSEWLLAPSDFDFSMPIGINYKDKIVIVKSM